jgi:protein-disulfide isomerase
MMPNPLPTPAVIGRALGRIAEAIVTRTGPRAGARWPFRLALAALLAGGGAAAALAMQSTGDATPPAERARIEGIVRDYLRAHPEVVLEAIRALKQQQLALVVEQNRAALETPYAGAWEGAAKPDVTVVQFFDYACGYCRASLPDLARLVKEDARVRIVYRELPILSEASGNAARVSLLAAESNRYMAYHAALYAAGEVTRPTILAAAAKAGLDPARAAAAYDDKGRDGEVESNLRLAQALEGSGTPLFVVGDQVLQGAVGFEALKAAVARARDQRPS